MENFLKDSAIYFFGKKHDINSFFYKIGFFAEIIAQSENPVKYADLTEGKSGHIVKADNVLGALLYFRRKK